MKPKVIYLLILLSFFFTETQSLAQDVTIPKVMKPSPEVASFQSRSHVPVSYYTGRPDISIPIFTLEGKGISTSVGLTYNAAGIKVEEEASQVGLGWSLNAGGMISRSIKGRDDFDGILRFNNTTQVAINNLLKENYVFSDDPTTGNTAKNFLGQIPGQPYETMLSFLEYRNISNTTCNNILPADQTLYNLRNSLASIGTGNQAGVPNFDTQSDIYTYQAGSYSGKFFISTDVPSGSTLPYIIYTQNQDPIRIEIAKDFGGNIDYTGRSGFVITLPDGTIYNFADFEETQSRSIKSRTGKLIYPETASNSPYVDNVETFNIPSLSSWHLSKIISGTNSNDYITFNYIKDTQLSDVSLPNRVQTFSLANNTLGNWSLTDTKQKNILLTSISSSYGTISFDRSSRLDMRGTMAQKIDAINISNDAGLVKKFVLSYSYFDSGTNKPDFVRKRLKLNSVKEYGTSIAGLPAHEFTYFDKINGYSGEQPATLPDKNSYAQDFWGYYNGEDANNTKNNALLCGNNCDEQTLGTLIPVDLTNLGGGLVERAKRESKMQFARLCTISSIVYPTGGFQLFNFECNTFKNYYATEYPQSIKVYDTEGSSSPIREGAGLRIESTKIYPDGSNTSNYLHRRYEYGDFGVANTTTGKLMFDQNFTYIASNNGTFGMFFSSGSQYPTSYSASGSPIGYSVVNEIDMQMGNSNVKPNGRTEYKFENKVDFAFNTFCFRNNLDPQWDNNNCFPQSSSLASFGNACQFYSIRQTSINSPTYAVVYDKIILQDFGIPNRVNIKNGKLKEKFVMNASDQPVLSEIYTYDSFTGAKKLKSINVSSRSIGDPYPALFTYFNYIEWVKLVDKTTIQYLPNVANKVEVVENYLYDDENKLVSKVTTTNSKGEELETITKYSNHVDNPLQSLMKGRNMIALVIEQIKRNKTKSKELFKVTTAYTNFGSTNFPRILPEKMKKIQNGFDDGSFDVIINYDTDNNIKELIPRSGVVSSFIWGYYGKYPLAEIKGKSYNDVTGILTTLGEDRATLQTIGDVNNLNTKMANLRGNLPSGSLMTNATYIPLIGISTSTNETGISTKFVYDPFNRLSTIKDNNDKIVKSYQYNFKNQ
jgi:YD repeat-containing protein